MNEIPWTFWAGSVAAVSALGLSTTLLALSDLSGGVVRKLELVNRDLAERLEPWLVRRDEYRAFLRLLLIGLYVFIAFCVADCDRTWAAADPPMSRWLRFGIPVAAAAIFFAISEALGRHQTALGSAKLLCRALPLLRILSIVLFVPSAVIFLVHRKVEAWHDVHSEATEKTTAEDEIMSLVEQDADEGKGESALEDDERRMIRGIFDLDETLVHEIMTPRVDVDGLPESADLAEVKSEIVGSGHSRLPIYRDSIDEIVGVIYAKDLLDDARVAQAPGIQAFFHTPVFIPETKNIGDLLEEFQQNRNHFAVVLDEYGGTAGIVTFEDILEEIVGEIQDEYDTDEVQPGSEELPDGTLVVDARITIDELNELLDIDLSEDEDYDTLGGYVSSEAGRIPLSGETLETDDLIITILEADPRRILRAQVQRRASDEAAADGGA